MVTGNVAPEERVYLKCFGGELCFSLYELEVRRSNPLRSLVGKMDPHFTLLRSHVSVQVPNTLIHRVVYGQINK